MLFVQILEVTIGKTPLGFLTTETIVWSTDHKPNAFCPNFVIIIWKSTIWNVDNIFHPFSEGCGVCVKAIPSTAATVKKGG